ncbi:MAG: M42 family metallopeptidase, partial [Oscillospiraceae bacterium]|nr:M42 family metallopeptidase [Oscillospiraceae bacterium]
DPPMLGVVACLPPHVLPAEDREKAPELKDLLIDVGLGQEEAQRRIPVGTPVVYRSGFALLGERQVCAKALDDRACFAALLRAAELLRDEALDVDLYILGSVCEEVGGVGARVGAQALAPDFCVAVDVTHGRTLDSSKDESFAMGGGPAVGLGPNCARWMVRRLLEKAEALDMAVQKEVMEGSTGTNGWEMQIANEGIATAVLSIPLKYMHTPVEVVELSDVEDTARLLAAFAAGLGEEAVQ